MTPSRLVASGLIAAGLVFATIGRAAILLSDNFENDHPATVTNVGSLSNWTISNGTVDYLKNYPGISCFGGSNGCLDMDGSTNDAGRITSSATFLIQSNVWYTLTAQVSGSQRSGLDSLALGVLDEDDGGAVWMAAATGNIAAATSFNPVELKFMNLGAPFNARIYFEGVGGDNVGVILDNVVFSDDSSTPGQGVSAPAPLLLAGAGLLAAGLVGRLRRRA